MVQPILNPCMKSRSPTLHSYKGSCHINYVVVSLVATSTWMTHDCRPRQWYSALWICHNCFSKKILIKYIPQTWEPGSMWIFNGPKHILEDHSTEIDCKFFNFRGSQVKFHKGSIGCLSHWGRVTHICVGNLTIIGSDNGLSPGPCQAIIWTNTGILFIGTVGTNFSDISNQILTFSFKEMHL